MSFWRRVFSKSESASEVASVTQDAAPPSDIAEQAEALSYHELLSRYSPAQLAQLFADKNVYKDRDGWLMVGSYKGAIEALQADELVNSPSRFSALHASKAEHYSSAFWGQYLLPFLDGDAHRSMRADLAASFLQAVREHSSDVDADVAEYWQRFRQQLSQRSSSEFLTGFASPLMWQLISRFLGIDAGFADWREAKDLSRSFFYLFSLMQSEAERETLNRDLKAFSQKLELMLKNRPDGSDGLCFQWLEQQGMNWTVANLMLLIADAMNADYMLANAFLALSQQPHFLEVVKQEQAWKQAADELMRFDSPSVYIARRAQSTTRMAGETLRQDAGVLVLLAVANRDAREFDQPDQLQLRNNSSRFLTMGKGAHACLGRLLVSDTLQACLRQWAELGNGFPRLSCGDYELRSGHRWLRSLDCHLC